MGLINNIKDLFSAMTPKTESKEETPKPSEENPPCEVIYVDFINKVRIK